MQQVVYLILVCFLGDTAESCTSVHGEGLQEGLETIQSPMSQEIRGLAELTISSVEVVQEPQVAVALSKSEFKVMLIITTASLLVSNSIHYSPTIILFTQWTLSINCFNKKNIVYFANLSILQFYMLLDQTYQSYSREAYRGRE